MEEPRDTKSRNTINMESDMSAFFFLSIDLPKPLGSDLFFTFTRKPTVTHLHMILSSP